VNGIYDIKKYSRHISEEEFLLIDRPIVFFEDFTATPLQKKDETPAAYLNYLQEFKMRRKQ
jgi:hypothetical protein